MLQTPREHNPSQTIRANECAISRSASYCAGSTYIIMYMTYGSIVQLKYIPFRPYSVYIYIMRAHTTNILLCDGR